jgi:hypothetical protein
MLFANFLQVSYSPSRLPYVLLAVAAGIGVVLYLRFRRGRADIMRAFASKRGLQWLGSVPPADFPRKILDEVYAGWVMPRWSAPQNVIGGMLGSDLLLAFDITVAKGDGVYHRTIVARRSPTAVPKSNFPKGYIYRCAGEWHLATMESSTMVVEKLIEPASIEKLWLQLA